ncbi:MAG: FAD-dependent oxidoreductase [Trueperaceae bacterium]|nr:FAD-dependent oxidoreductase [Trueperaceae bacterium]
MATKPIILSVDDDPQVLGAVSRDLRKQYGKDYRIIRASSGQEALETLKELKARAETVALFLADQRMPQMDGVGFLSGAMELFPEAKRALLTAYADTDAAIAAINRSQIHYYLLKPWDPPEEKLYPVLDDLLDDWQANFIPPFSGIRIIGDRWSAEAHMIRDFLARHQVPYRWLDVEREESQEFIVTQNLKVDDLPLVLFEDGSKLVKPTVSELAERAGLRTQAESEFYDLIIVGAGPAGLASAVYGASEGLEVVILDRQAPGGQAGTSSRIENYLGFPVGLSGGDLARRAVAQARKFGAEFITPQEVKGIELNDPYKIVKLQNGSTISSHALVIATGVAYQKLKIPGLDALTGLGVYYGASISEASACQNEDVYIVGAGNSAGQAAMYLAQFARSVTLLVRGDSLEAKMSQYLVERIYEAPTIQVLLNTEIAEVQGTEHLEGLTLMIKGERREVTTSALFVFVGAAPATSWLGDTVARDDKGFVYTGVDTLVNGKLPKTWTLERQPFLLETSVPGIFAAGDVRHQSVKRVASAVGEGSIALQFIHQYLADLRS